MYKEKQKEYALNQNNKHLSGQQLKKRTNKEGRKKGRREYTQTSRHLEKGKKKKNDGTVQREKIISIIPFEIQYRAYKTGLIQPRK